MARAPQSVLFEEVLARSIQVEFDGHQHTSDAGALLFGKLDRRIGLTARLAATLTDSRDPHRTTHAMEQLVRQRVFQIALGYPDCNDGNHLRTDPTLKALVGRQPVAGNALASQPTLSRFENAPSARDLIAFANELEHAVVDLVHQRHPNARHVTIDLDPTLDRTHGKQQLTFFNGHYDDYCYLPLLGFLTVDDDPQHFLVAARLRAGRASATKNARPILRHLVERLRAKFPGVRILVRLDGGFATPRLLQMLDELEVDYVVGMPKNTVLCGQIAASLEDVRTRAQSTQQTQQSFCAFEYEAGSWAKPRRIVAKVEATVQPGRDVRDNPRFVVTNLVDGAERVYEVYRGRGDIENAIKELQLSLELDRTSCSRFLANQLRVLLTATAFALYQQFRLYLADTELERAQIWRLREVLFKIGAVVIESVRRVLFRLPQSYPSRELWCTIASRLALS